MQQNEFCLGSDTTLFPKYPQPILRLPSWLGLEAELQTATNSKASDYSKRPAASSLCRFTFHNYRTLKPKCVAK